MPDHSNLPPEQMTARLAFSESAPLPQSALDTLAYLDAKDARIAELEEAVASALTSLATGPMKDGYAYAVLNEVSLKGKEAE